MNIIEIKDIVKIINTKAKYQKVMLIHDDSVTNAEILNIYESIKEICIYNQVDISRDSDIYAKVNDGYRVLIFMCGVDKFLSLKIDRYEFVNVYIPTDNSLLPYFLDFKMKLRDVEDYLVLNSTAVDVSAITSLYFNKFYNYLRNLVIMKPNNFDFSFSHEITTNKVLEGLDELKLCEFDFSDVELIAKSQISYDRLPLVDYILITALTVLIRAVKTHTLSLVDVYKSAGDDYALIDKFYAMYHNESLIGLINLNFYYLSTAVERTREKILEILTVSYQYDKRELDKLVNQIKAYSKADKGIFGYLYLYNIFSV